MKPLLLLPLSALYICSLADNVFDVNKDGVVNSADVASFYNLVISGKDCDINNDGGTNAADAVAIYNYIAHGHNATPVFRAEKELLTDGEWLSLPKNSVKSNKRMELLFTIDSADARLAITTGHGYKDYLSSWCVLTSDSIETHTYTDKDNTSKFPHSSKLVGKVRVIIEKNLSGSRANLTIVTETDSTTKSIPWIGDNATTRGIYAGVKGGALKDCSLIWGGACLSSRIWMFGDSYFALDNPARWTYWLPQDKQNLILFNAFSGAKSKAIIEDFENLLQVAKPEMAVWCLGMNDKDNSTSKYSTTPNPSWLNATEKFLALCRQHGITPVLTTIPTVIGGNLSTNTPAGAFRYHGAKNKWVKESGCRYIDFAAAVGANDTTGYWHGEGTDEHMLEGTDDNRHMRVHPTTNGAKALYRQAIKDCVELTDD